VLPGLIDLHTHIADGATSSADPAEPLKHGEAATILKSVPAARTMLRAGFTTARDVGVYRGLTDVALRDAINAGEIEGPRMFVAGGYITTPGGGGEIDALAPDVPVPEAFRVGVVRNADEARDKARYLLDHGADFIKLIATGAVLALGSEPGALELSPDEMKAACDEAKLRGSYCIAHAHGAEGIKAAIRAGARTIEHASYLDAEGSR
jgi:imidazolonepropionase-like amidohydrolase